MPFDGTGFAPAPIAPTPAWPIRIVGFLRRLAAPAGRQSELIDAATLRVLEEARGLIAQREDWTQGTLETKRGERCAVGAVRLAADFLDYPRPAGAPWHCFPASPRARLFQHRGHERPLAA